MSEKETISPKEASYGVLYSARDIILNLKESVPYDLDPRVDEALLVLDNIVKEMGEELCREE